MLAKPQVCSIPTFRYAKTRAEPWVFSVAADNCSTPNPCRQVSCQNQTVLQRSDPRLGAPIGLTRSGGAITVDFFVNTIERSGEPRPTKLASIGCRNRDVFRGHPRQRCDFFRSQRSDYFARGTQY